MNPERDATLTVLDAAQFGEPSAGCVYLLHGEKSALIDTGTAANAPRLLEALRGVHLHYVFVTHVHLDHAGAVGHLAAAHPETQFVVHPRGLPHLVDPTRLVVGVRAASPDLAPLYGEPLPVDPRRLVACSDCASFAIGRDHRLVVVESPGHAPHHVCVVDSKSGVLFVGDAAGHHGAPVDLPLTVPPRFDLAASRDPIRRLIELRPRTLAFAHFGLAGDAATLLASYQKSVEAWVAHIVGLRDRLGEDHVADAVLAEPRCAALSTVGRAVARMCVLGALASVKSAETGSGSASSASSTRGDRHPGR